jgi:saccharopine dehydrogenase-like NADP-dependent oxidoreductase
VRIAVLGAGAVGSRAVRQLASTPAVDAVSVADLDPARAERCVAAIDDERVTANDAGEGWATGADVGVVASPPGGHRREAERLLERGAAVVSTSDDPDDVSALLDLDAEARERQTCVVAGAAFAPGLTDLLAAHAATTFDAVDEVHVARVGTGGPACARAHHRALRGGEVQDWRDGAWVRRRAGSGRELCWFPDPVGAADCYRAAVPDALLLVPAFPGVRRVTGRVGANRRDRLTSWLPMLRRPHPEGATGATRVEVRGRRGTGRDTVVLGALDRPAVAAGAVAALAAVWQSEGRILRHGAGGLAELVEPLPFLVELARRGVRAAVFEGAASAP